MAKQFANPVERHLEKGVLGIAGLILIGAIARYLATTPNQIELDGETVTPATVDAKLAQKAASVRQRIRDASPQVEMPEPLAGEFARLVAPVEPTPLPYALALRPEVPAVDLAQTTLGQAGLVEVVQLPKPETAHGRSTFVIQREDARRYLPVNWVTVASVFSVEAQSERQRATYGPAYGKVIFGPIELQRRAQRPDGSWSDDDWDFVNVWPSANFPQVPDIKVVEDQEGRLQVSPESARALDEFLRMIGAPELRLQILRPIMPEELNGTRWRFPEVLPYRDVLKQDDEIMYPTEPPAENPEDRYGIQATTPRAQPKVAQDLKQRYDENLRKGRELLEEAYKVNSLDLCARAYNQGAEIVRNADKADPRQLEEARKLVRDAEQAERDIQRRIRIGGVQQQPDAGEDEEETRRELLPKHVVWAHDARAGSVAGGRTYQYRIRANVVNPLVGKPSRFADPTDATVVLIPGPWSAPSDPVRVSPEIELYFSSDDPRDNEIGVEVFKWFEGVWTRARRMKFTIGEVVAGNYRHGVKAVDGQVDNALIEFDTNAIVVDLDFDRTYRERRRGTGRDGFKLGPRTETTSVAYVDADGNIRERLVPVEKADPSRRSASSRTWKPPTRP